MREIICILILIASYGAAAVAAAEPTSKVRRIGYLAAARGPSPFFDGLKQGLRDSGHVEGQNLVIEYRSSEDLNQLAAMAADLVKLKVDVIVSQGLATRVAKSATTTLPIVFGFSGDPVEAGFVESLARPGTNLTGMSFLSLDLAGKRLELLKEAAPKVSRVAIVSTHTHPGEKNELKETRAAALALKTELQYLPVTTSNEIDQAFDAIVKDRADAILIFRLIA